MNAAFCPSPLDWSTLIAYRLGELEPDGEARIEEHYLGCSACAGRLEWLTALAREVPALTRESRMSLIVNDRFVRKLSEDGVRVREYRVPCNGSVNCTVTPEDDWVVARLEAPLGQAKRVDVIYLDDDGGVRQEDVPFIAESGAVVFSTRIDALRALPSTVLRVRLVAVDEGGERPLGDYTFNHTRYVPQGTG